MTTTLEHPLHRIQRDAGIGHFPPADRRAEVGPPLPGPCDAMSVFTQHIVVAAEVTEDWVYDKLAHQLDRPENDPSTGLGIFVGALAGRLGNPPMTAALLQVAPYQPAFIHGKITTGGQADPTWAAYRTDVRCYHYRSKGVNGLFALGQGPGGRWDVYIRVEETTGAGSHASRELLIAAKTLVPDRELLFASAPLHDPRVLRAYLGSGFLPICTEVLFLTRPPHWAELDNHPTRGERVQR